MSKLVSERVWECVNGGNDTDATSWDECRDGGDEREEIEKKIKLSDSVFKHPAYAPHPPFP